MTDLFDRAKPVRDSILPELARVLRADVPAEVRDGHQLGSHFVATLIGFTSERHSHMRGEIADPGLMRLLSIAVANAATHCAASFRPIINGRPMSPSASAQCFLQLIAQETIAACAQIEAGAQDFVIPFDRDADGVLRPQAFDVRDMLKGGTK